MKTTQSQGSEVHVPEAVVNGLESDVLASQDVEREMVPKARSPAEEQALVARYKRRLQELGHLPR